MPMAGGVLAALEYAIETGCETFQIFSKSPRRWVSPALDEDVCAAFRQGVVAADVGPVFCHGSYLVNTGSGDEALWERSIAGLADEFVRARQVAAAGLVLHLGRRFSDDDAESIERCRAAIVRAAEMADGDTPPLLVENSAGAGRQFGVTIDELLRMVEALRSSGIGSGICIDTCHALAAGIEVRDLASWEALVGRIDAAAGPGTIALVHANDCKGALGSHKDRHEWIGDGCIGETGFSAMFSIPGLSGASAVCEMPGEVPEKDVVNVSRLRAIRAAAAESAGPGRAPA